MAGEQPETDFVLDAEAVAQDLKIRKEIYLKIVASFSANLFGKLEALEKGFREDNREEIRRILHEIRGTAGNLRLTDISAVEAVMHNAVKAGTPLAEIHPHMAGFHREAQRLKRFVSPGASEEAAG